MMNPNQVLRSTERIGIGKGISDLWNSRNRVVRLIMLGTLGLVLNCCCIIIPIPHSSTGITLAAPSDVSVHAISIPAISTAQDPLIPAGLEISANTNFDVSGDGSVACMNFNSQATAHIQLHGGNKGGRSCKSLP